MNNKILEKKLIKPKKINTKSKTMHELLLLYKKKLKLKEENKYTFIVHKMKEEEKNKKKT